MLSELRSALAIVVPPVLALAVVDAIWSTQVATPAVVLNTIYAFGVLAIPALPIALASIGLVRWVAISGLGTVLTCCLAIVGASYPVTAMLIDAFNNRELSALVIVSFVAFLASVFVGLSHSRIGRIISAWIAVAGVCWVLIDNIETWAQLSPTYTVGFALAAMLYAIGLFLHGNRKSRLWLGFLIAPLLLLIGHFTSADSTTRKWELTGPVQSHLDRLTDFDDDGASAWFGGGDCAAFDKNIAPNIADVPGDGIDNNCRYGDSQMWASAAPTFDRDAVVGKVNVLLFSIDTVRPDHTSLHGYERNTTPELDRLAKESIVFDRFYASSTYTRLALASLFSSKPPSRVDFRATRGSKLPKIAATEIWLPRVLQTEGYETAAFLPSFSAFRSSIGFRRGFDEYDATSKLTYRGGTMTGFPIREQVGLFEEWLEDRESPDPFFAWIHAAEPHYKYEQFPGAPVFGKNAIDRYDSEIAGVDAQLRKAVDALRKHALLDNTIVVVLGDHGEAFQEHGKKWHGSSVYDVQARTILLIRVPGLDGQRIKTTASHQDTAATLLNLLGAEEAFDKFGGKNYAPVTIGKAAPDSPVIVETWKIKNWASYSAAIVDWPLKVVMRGKDSSKIEIFDLSSDPAELKPLDRDYEPAEPLLESLLRFADGTSHAYPM